MINSIPALDSMPCFPAGEAGMALHIKLKEMGQLRNFVFLFLIVFPRSIAEDRSAGKFFNRENSLVGPYTADSAAAVSTTNSTATDSTTADSAAAVSRTD